MVHSQGPSHDGTRGFVERHRKRDGAYGVLGAPDGAPRPTSWALRIHRLLGGPPPDRSRVLAALASLRVSRDATTQDLLALARCYRSLDAPLPDSLIQQVPLAPTWPDFAGWMGSAPLTHLADYARLASELSRPWSPAERRIVARYLTVCRVKGSGTFGFPLDLESAVACLGARRPPEPADVRADHAASLEGTTAALALLDSLGRPAPEGWAADLESWRQPDGGYGWTGGRRSDLEATRRVMEALSRGGRKPPDPQRLRRWLRNLGRPDGGFSPGPDEASSLEATWQALEIAAALDGDVDRILSAAHPRGKTDAPASQDPARDLRLFQAVVEMGPPSSVAVELARRIGAHLILVKADGREPEMAERMNAIAVSRGLAIRAACGREEYSRGIWWRPGVGFATHSSDILFRPSDDIKDRSEYESFEALVRAWEPVKQVGGLVLSCSWLHRELLTPVLERSCRRPGGWDALMASWPFAEEGDVLRDHPWLDRYVPRLAMIGNHDAHQECFQWLPFGLRTRTLFFARTGDFEGFRDAVLHRRTIAVAHGKRRLRLSGGPRWVARAHAERSRWDRGRNEIDQGKAPPAPLAAPLDRASGEDLLTLQRGYGLLVRAARGFWDDAMPEEVDCRVDGRPVTLALTPPLGHPFPALWCPLPGLRAGPHRVEVEAFGRRTAVTLRFGAPVAPRPSPPLPPPGNRKTHLTFDSPADMAFLRSWPRPVIMGGALRLTSPRTDVFLFRPAHRGQGYRLRLRWRAGRDARTLEVFLNGHRVQRMDRPGHWLVHLPRHALIEGFQRISFRTPVAPWRPGVRRNPAGPRILDLALETTRD